MTSHAFIPSLAIGIGCRRGTSADAIESAVRAALGVLAFEHNFECNFEHVACVASIEAKRDEAGLIEFCERHRLRLLLFNAEAIARTSCTFSPHAREHMKVDAVCEPCALLASQGGQLIVAKTISGGVTVAIAQTSLNNEA